MKLLFKRARGSISSFLSHFVLHLTTQKDTNISQSHNHLARENTDSCQHPTDLSLSTKHTATALTRKMAVLGLATPLSERCLHHQPDGRSCLPYTYRQSHKEPTDNPKCMLWDGTRKEVYLITITLTTCTLKVYKYSGCSKCNYVQNNFNFYPMRCFPIAFRMFICTSWLLSMIRMLWCLKHARKKKKIWEDGGVKYWET